MMLNYARHVMSLLDACLGILFQLELLFTCYNSSVIFFSNTSYYSKCHVFFFFIRFTNLPFLFAEKVCYGIDKDLEKVAKWPSVGMNIERDWWKLMRYSFGELE
ncbi:hypothetical protein L6452_38401 [Arctium lappa]|uniref:Uncharacterized protein n=1 Tax=Arctium lappa TaxID=4217 RepID=A0ACB8Y751_ARCLA|nr:hypothetical protein L6452_38401 [Arctium lappa]